MKDNTTVLTATEKATKGLQAAATNLVKITDSISIFKDEVEKLNEDIAIKTQKIEQLDVELKDKVRRHKIDLDFKIEENKEAVLGEILKERKLVTISSTDRAELELKAVQNETEIKEAVDKAVSDVRNVLTKDHEAALNKKDLEVAASNATLKAQITSLEEKVTFLEGQLSAAAEREKNKLDAEVKIAEAGKGVTINTSSGK